MAKEKLTHSPRLNSLLYQMGIYSFYDVLDHLPRRYDDYSLTAERGIEDKERITIYAKAINAVSLSKSFKKISISSFDVLTDKGTYFKVIAYNRPYLGKLIKIDEYYTIIGIFDKKKNVINLINLVSGKIAKSKALRPLYSLPRDFANKDYINLVNKSLNELKGKIYSLVPYSLMSKYRLINKEEALKHAHQPRSYEDIHQSLRYLKYEEALCFSLKNQLINESNRSLSKIKKEPIGLESCEPFIKSLPYELTEDQIEASTEIIEDMNQSSLMYRLLQGDVGTGKTLVSFLILERDLLLSLINWFFN